MADRERYAKQRERQNKGERFLFFVQLKSLLQPAPGLQDQGLVGVGSL